MLAKRVNNRLLCSFSEFEAKILRNLLGNVTAGGQGYTQAFKTICQMGDCFAESGVYYMDIDPFSGGLAMMPGAVDIITIDIEQNGWNS